MLGEWRPSNNSTAKEQGEGWRLKDLGSEKACMSTEIGLRHKVPPNVPAYHKLDRRVDDRGARIESRCREKA